MVTLVKSDSFYSVELDRVVSGKSWTLGKHTIDWDSATGFMHADGLTLATDVWNVYAAADHVSDYANSLLG